jgi:hypothetical protein
MRPVSCQSESSGRALRRYLIKLLAAKARYKTSFPMSAQDAVTLLKKDHARNGQENVRAREAAR